MDDQQFKEFMLALKEKDDKEPVTVKHDLVDSVSKIGVALCTAMIIYVVTQISGITTSMAVMESKMEAFGKFAESPRFTSENNAVADQKLLSIVKEVLTPMSNEIRQNSNSISYIEAELIKRNDFMNDIKNFKSETDKRFNEINVKLNMIELKLSDDK